MTHQEYIFLIQEKCKKLGAVPKRRDFSSKEQKGMMHEFGSYANAVSEAGYRPSRIKKITADELVISLRNYYNKYGKSPSISTSKIPGLLDQAVYKRVLKCKTWSDVLRVAGLPVYIENKDIPLDDDQFIEYSIEFIRVNSIKNMRELLQDRRFRSQEYIENHFGSVREFATLIGMEMMDFNVSDEIIHAEILRVYELLGRVPSIPDMAANTKYDKYFFYQRGMSYNNMLLSLGLVPRKKNENCTLSDEELVSLYIDISKQNGLKKGATKSEIDKLCPYKYNAFVYRFGSLNELRQEAGFQPIITIQKKYSKECVIHLLEEKTKEIGRILTMDDIKNDPKLPSPSTIRRCIPESWDVMRKLIWVKYQSKNNSRKKAEHMLSNIAFKAY